MSDQTACPHYVRKATETQYQCNHCNQHYSSLENSQCPTCRSDDALPIWSVRECSICKHTIAGDTGEYLAYKHILDLLKQPNPSFGDNEDLAIRVSEIEFEKKTFRAERDASIVRDRLMKLRCALLPSKDDNEPKKEGCLYETYGVEQKCIECEARSFTNARIYRKACESCMDDASKNAGERSDGAAWEYAISDTHLLDTTDQFKDHE